MSQRGQRRGDAPGAGYPLPARPRCVSPCYRLRPARAEVNSRSTATALKSSPNVAVGPTSRPAVSSSATRKSCRDVLELAIAVSLTGSASSWSVKVAKGGAAGADIAGADSCDSSGWCSLGGDDGIAAAGKKRANLLAAIPVAASWGGDSVGRLRRHHRRNKCCMSDPRSVNSCRIHSRPVLHSQACISSACKQNLTWSRQHSAGSSCPVVPRC